MPLPAYPSNCDSYVVMAAIIIGTISLTVMCRMLWLIMSNGMENSWFSNQTLHPHDISCNNVHMYVAKLSEISNTEPTYVTSIT